MLSALRIQGVFICVQNAPASIAHFVHASILDEMGKQYLQRTEIVHLFFTSGQ